MIHERIQSAIDLKLRLLESQELLQTVDRVRQLMVSAFLNGNKVLFCGNGGSAADAQHLAAELSGRFYKTRPALYAEALHCNSSYLTAVANDFSYDEIYARLIEGMAQPGDLLVALSTSGNSVNILRAANTAKSRQMMVIGMTGMSGGRLKDFCHYLINIPSSDTARIQEAHMLLGHIICEQVEAELFSG